MITMFDELLTSRRWPRSRHEAEQLEKIHTRLRSARRIVLDEAASRHAARVIRDAPELIAAQLEFAIPPFENTWIEFDLRAFDDEMGVIGRQDRPDVGFAFSIHHDFTLMFCRGHGTNPLDPTDIDEKLEVHALPFGIARTDAWSVAEQLEICHAVGVSRIQLDATMWGSSYDRLDDTGRRALRARYAFVPVYDPGEEFARQNAAAFNKIFLSMGGDVRNMAAILLLLARPNVTEVDREVAPRRTFRGGRQVRYLGHSVVTIRVDPVASLRRTLVPGDGAGPPRRSHDVRGHLCQDRVARTSACEHVWGGDPSRPDAEGQPRRAWLCQACGGKRWWRKDHRRGSAAVGFVDQTYLATAADE